MALTEVSGRPTECGRALFSMEGRQVVAVRLIKRGVTALVCAYDVLALGAIRAARRLGLALPGKVSVVGFDESAFTACTIRGDVRQPIESMSHAAVPLLTNLVGGNDIPVNELFFETELVVRGSTAPASVAVS